MKEPCANRVNAAGQVPRMAPFGAAAVRAEKSPPGATTCDNEIDCSIYCTFHLLPRSGSV